MLTLKFSQVILYVVITSFLNGLLAGNADQTLFSKIESKFITAKPKAVATTSSPTVNSPASTTPLPVQIAPMVQDVLNELDTSSPLLTTPTLLAPAQPVPSN